jgi:hypothetical protein
VLADLAQAGQAVDVVRRGQQRLAMAQHVFGEAAAVRARQAHGVEFVDRVREGELVRLFVQQRDIEVARVQQAADDAVHGGVEVVQAFRGVGQFRDAEQRRLQAFAALALQHLLAQHAVGFAQRGGAAGHAAFQFGVGFAAFQRGLHVLGHVAEQLAIVFGVVGVFAVALHHDAADHAPVALQRHAEPVLAHRAEQHELAGELAREFLHRTHDRLAALQQVPGEAVAHVLQRHALVGQRRVLVHGVDVVREAHAVGGRVVQGDVEIFRVHQAAENAVQRVHHLGHVVFGAGLVGDGVERALQALGHGQAGDGLVQARSLGQLAQAGGGHAAQPGDFLGVRGRHRPFRGQDQQALALGILGQGQLARQERVGRRFQCSPEQGAAHPERTQYRPADLGDPGRVAGPEQAFHGRMQRRGVGLRRRKHRGGTGGY